MAITCELCGENKMWLRVKVGRSKSGLPTLTEEGGGMTNRGRAVIVARPDGTPPRAIHVFSRGHLACGEHAVIPVEPGFFYIKAKRYRERAFVEAYVIKDIGTDDEARLEQVWQGDVIRGVVPDDVPPTLKTAVEAAAKKAACYHCRQPHFVKPRN